MQSNETPRILKADALRGLGSQVVFNFDDLRRQCDDYVDETRRHAQTILDDARREADEMRQRTYEQARQAGRKHGLEEAEEHIHKRAAELADIKAREALHTALPALQAAAETLRQERDHWLADWETAAVRLCAAIAEKLLRREVQRTPELVRTMFAETLQLVVGTASIRVRVHPDDLRVFGNAAEEMVCRMASCGQATLVPDETVSPGGCVIETQHGCIDGRVETQIERITSELLQNDDG